MPAVIHTAVPSLSLFCPAWSHIDPGSSSWTRRAPPLPAWRRKPRRDHLNLLVWSEDEEAGLHSAHIVKSVFKRPLVMSQKEVLHINANV